MAPNALAVYTKARRIPLLGMQLFSLGFRAMAPYFLTIPAVTESLQPGSAVVRMAPRPWTRNHLGTVHAIALCNLAEVAMGLTAEATVPDTHRWIPKAMSVRYLAKARGVMRAEATARLPEDLAEPVEVPVSVSVCDRAGVQVFTAVITIWVRAR